MTPIDLTRLRDFSDGTQAGLRDLAALLLDVEKLGVAQKVDEAAALVPAVASEVARVREFVEATLEQVRDA